MGQYFKAVIDFGDEVKVYDPWSFDNGAKLMEHSWIGNDFVGQIYEELRAKGPARVAWVGDYSESESLDKNSECFLSDVFGDGEKRERVQRYFDLAWKSRDEQDDENRFVYSRELTEHSDEDYLLNLDKKEYIRVPALNWDKMQVHPLPVLTCSNPGSGGNFHPQTDLDEQIFCSWCGDLLGIVPSAPKGEAWTEIPYVFEGRY